MIGDHAFRRRAIEATYKAEDVESPLDLYFFRPIGYVLALFFARLRFTPSMVSFLGASVGVAAGHLYYYADLRLNMVGMSLHFLANALDNADGQLARLTNRGSLLGAIADGFADYVVFLSVYLHLGLRYGAEGWSRAIWLLVAAAGISHAFQSLAIDHLRNAYLQFVDGKNNADANSPETVRAAYQMTTWREFWRKAGLRNYLSYTRRQESIAPNLLRLRLALRGATPLWLRAEYRAQCRPLVKWCNGLAANPRILLLLVFLLAGQPVWYLVAETTILNLLLIFVLFRHDRIFRSLLARLERTPEPAV